MSRGAPGWAVWIAAAIGLAAWSGLAARVPPVLLPSPLEVAVSMWEHAAVLAQATAITGAGALGGLAVATILGVAGGIAFLWSRTLERALLPYALLVQTVPIVAIAPLLVIWLGYGVPVAAAAAAIAAFFPLLTATHVGLSSAPPARVELLRLYGATWSQELIKLRIPGALPHFFAGLRTAGGLAVIGAIVGEFVGSNGAPPSLGNLVLRSARSADTPQTFAAIGCAAAMAIGFYGLIRAVEWRSIGRWFARS